MVRPSSATRADAAAAVLLAGLLAASCLDAPAEPRHAASPPRPLPVEAAATVPKAAPVDAAPEYYPSLGARDAQPDLVPAGGDGDGGLLIDGWRLTFDGQRFADDGAEPPLQSGTRVPSSLGGGFLFWSSRSLYYARSFLGALEPLWSLPRSVSRVRFGRDFALLQMGDGARVVLAMPSKQPGLLPLPGLVDLATLGDGRAVMVTEPDRTLVSASASGGWRDASVQVGSPQALVANAGELWLETERGTGLRLERDGSLTEFDRVPAAVRRRPSRVLDPRWPLSDEAPIERAVRRGVPAGRALALVEAGGAIARVRIPTGEIVDITRRALPSDATCDLVPVPDDVVAVCKTPAALFVTGGLSGGKEPTIERTFVGRERFVASAEGALGYDGPCQPTSDESATVCLRGANGRWRDVPLGEPVSGGAAHGASRPDAGGPSGPPAPVGSLRDRVARWVPRADGSVVVVYGAPRAGLWDSRSNTHVEWEPDAAHAALDAVAWGNGARHVVVDNLAAAADASLVGYVRRQAVQVRRDGRVVPSPWVMSSLASAGRLGFGRTSDGRFWQSLDFGQHWTEVAPPPAASTKGAPTVDPVACSPIGCDLRRWYRFGYPTSQPIVRAAAVVPEPPRWPAEPLPRLVCEAAAAPLLTLARRALDRDGSPRDELDLGAHTTLRPNHPAGELTIVASTFAVSADTVPRSVIEVDSALLELESPEAGTALGRPRTLRFYDPLSASPQIAAARFTWRELVRASASLGYPDFGLLQGDGGLVVALPEDRVGAFAGMLLVDTAASVALLARDRQPVRILPLGSELEERELVGALRLPSDELALLLRGESCGARVLAWSAGGGRVVLEVPERGTGLPCPADGDALALTTDGRIGLLRLPSGPAAPRRDDPPILILPGQPPARLAPWSALRTADDPACSTPDGAVRLLLLTAERWLDLELPGREPEREPGDWMLAQLRWGASHVCLEAVELPASVEPFPEGEVPTAVVARFAPKLESTLRGYGLGAELHQPLRCSLRSTP